MKRIIVTGASGFIGREVVKNLCSDNYEVHCLTTREVEDAEKINKVVKWHKVNLRKYDQIEKIFNHVNPHSLVHMAWNVKDRSYKNSEDNLNWIGITLKILMEFKKNGGKRVVFAGTCFEYDLKEKNLNEDTAKVSGINLYGVCKGSLSRIVKKYCEDNELSYAWGRIFYCFGPFENEKRIIPYVIRNLIENREVVISSDEQVLDYLSVEEVGRAFYEILISDIFGEVNIGAGVGINLKETLIKIGRILQKEELIRFSDGIKAQYPKIIADNKKLLEKTKWSYDEDIDKKLYRTIEWWKECIENER